MADNDDQKPARSQADKERSRQQSRAVSSREAAKGVSGKPGQGQKPSAKGPAKGVPQRGANRPAGRGAGSQRPLRSGGSTKSKPPRRSPTALLTWGVVALVVIVVIVLVVVKFTSSSTSTSGSAPSPQPVPAAIAQQVTGIPASVYDAVGVTSPTVPVTAPREAAGQPALTSKGKPEVFFVGGEFCPFCAAQRWAIIASLSRFGTFTGLQTMQSSSTDVYPSTQTFTFVNAQYKSPYITLESREIYSNQENSAGTGWALLQPLTKAQTALLKKYDVPKYTGGSATESGSIPFVDIGNRFIVAGASYSPSTLQGLSRSQIASALSDPKDPATKAIVASSNYISASICAIDGGKPASVCTSKGVTEAAKALGVKS